MSIEPPSLASRFMALAEKMGLVGVTPETFPAAMGEIRDEMVNIYARYPDLPERYRPHGMTAEYVRQVQQAMNTGGGPWTPFVPNDPVSRATAMAETPTTIVKVVDDVAAIAKRMKEIQAEEATQRRLAEQAAEREAQALKQ